MGRNPKSDKKSRKVNSAGKWNSGSKKGSIAALQNFIGCKNSQPAKLCRLRNFRTLPNFCNAPFSMHFLFFVSYSF